MSILKKILWLWLIVLSLGFIDPVYCQDNYRLGPEDEIEIRVWDHEDLTRKVRVGLEGRISFPFVGEIKADGLTLPQLQKELEHRLAQGYIVNPNVSITVITYKSQKFFVIGNVNKPGTYPLTKPIKLVEAISQAGGLPGVGGGKTGTGAVAIIVRAQPGEKADKPRMPDQTPPSQKMTVSLSAALGGDPTHNLAIENGDTIFVPNLVFYITGEVKKPGRYPYEANLTILNAATLAEGFTDKASRRSIMIIRQQKGGEKKFKVKLDDHFSPEDTIVVPESFF